MGRFPPYKGSNGATVPALKSGPLRPGQEAIRLRVAKAEEMEVHVVFFLMFSFLVLERYQFGGNSHPHQAANAKIAELEQERSRAKVRCLAWKEQANIYIYYIYTVWICMGIMLRQARC